MPVKVSQTYKPTVRLTAHRGWYRVQSGTDPHTWYETSANSCTCPARKPCKHQKFVRSLNVSFYVKKEAATTPAAVTLPAVAFARGWDDGASAEAGDTGPLWRQAPATARADITSGRCTICGEYDRYLRGGLCVLCEMDSDEAQAAAGVDVELAQVEHLLVIKRRALLDAHPQSDEYATLLRAVDQAERAVAAANLAAFRAA